MNRFIREALMGLPASMMTPGDLKPVKPPVALLGKNAFIDVTWCPTSTNGGKTDRDHPAYKVWKDANDKKAHSGTKTGQAETKKVGINDLDVGDVVELIDNLGPVWKGKLGTIMRCDLSDPCPIQIKVPGQSAGRFKLGEINRVVGKAGEDGWIPHNGSGNAPVPIQTSLYWYASASLRCESGMGWRYTGSNANSWRIVKGWKLAPQE